MSEVASMHVRRCGWMDIYMPVRSIIISSLLLCVHRVRTCMKERERTFVPDMMHQYNACMCSHQALPSFVLPKLRATVLESAAGGNLFGPTNLPSGFILYLLIPKVGCNIIIVRLADKP